MCQRKWRGEQRNEGVLLLLLAGVLLLFPSSPLGSSALLPGCEARLLPVDGALLGRGGTRGSFHGYAGGEENSLRRMVRETPSPHSSPSSERAPSRAPAMAPSADNGNTTSNTSNSWDDSNGGGVPYLWAIIVGPVLFVLFLAFAIAARMRLVARKRGREAGTTWKKSVSFHENQQLEKYTFAGLPTITFEELEAACEEFTNVIASSADCKVFKGTRVSDGLQIAVTRMLVAPQKWTAKREIGFRHKVEDLARMNHGNMVNLVAYCATDCPFERILVFEYASNGTLYEHLHYKGAAEDHLDWNTRIRIIMGAACGLEYLHHKLVPPTSHFKFDARHVFLTEDYSAKLADFAVSPESVDNMDMRSLGRRKSFAKIATVIGYSDWEGYRHTPNLESNIRSFGVFLLEVITGRRPFTDSQGPLVEWAKEYIHDPDKMWYLVDPSLKDYKKQELVAICEVVRMCIRPKGNVLPTMNELADVLSRELRMTREAANRKASPLMWAELELLSSMDHSLDEAPVASSAPKHRQLNSLGSGNKLNTPFSPKSTTKNLNNDFAAGDVESAAQSPLPRVSPRPLSTNHSSKLMWASDLSELELLSPQDSSSEESQDVPLAASINSTLPQDHSFGRSFRRVWAENSTEMSKLDLVSPRGERRSRRSDNLDR